MNYSKTLALLLILASINLTVMVPGGGIDTRDFSHISPILLSIFNTYLTLLGLISIFLPYFLLKNIKWSLLASFASGMSYFIIYVIDFAKIFPKSPDEMPFLLIILETFGVILSIPIMFISILSLKKFEYNNSERLFLSKKLYLPLMIALLIGIAIIIFATQSAMTHK